MLKKLLKAVLLIAVFISGFTIGGFTGLSLDKFQTESITNTGIKFQALESVPSEQEISSEKSELNFQNPVERISPYNWINEADIEMRTNGVFIKIDDPRWAIIADTNSMDPVIDENTHVIQKVPKTPSDVHVGDIISYDSGYGFTIIHRVISTGSDKNGWYAVAKGDNNEHIDPNKVRFKDIRKVLVAIIY